MSTEIGVIRGASEKEVKSKKFDIYIGVSLGNKWFTKENIKQYILWCIKYTKSKVAVLIADTLHSINYEVRNRESSDKALKRAIKEGDKFEKIVKEIISELPKDQQKIIEILRWEDVKEDPFNKKFIPFFFNEFKTNLKFKEEILKLVKGFTKKDSKNFSQKDIEKLCEYILIELPEILHGFIHKRIYYNCYVYPYDSPLTRMVEKIQNKTLFPHFHKKIGIQSNVFVELLISPSPLKGVLFNHNNS